MNFSCVAWDWFAFSVNQTTSTTHEYSITHEAYTDIDNDNEDDNDDAYNDDDHDMGGDGDNTYQTRLRKRRKDFKLS